MKTETVNWQNLLLPCFLVGDGLIPIPNRKRLSLIPRQHVAEGRETYYWAADNYWYRIAKVNNWRTPNPIENWWNSGIYVYADFELEIMPIPPVSLKFIHRDCLLLLNQEPKIRRKKAIAELRLCNTCEDFIAWKTKWIEPQRGYIAYAKHKKDWA